MRYGIAVFLLGALLLTGCGGGFSSSSSSSSATSEKAPQNAEESIEGYGEEASGSDREALLSAFHEYFGSLADGEDTKACAFLSSRVQESLQILAAKAKKHFTCAELLEALLSPDAKQIAKGQAEGKIEKVRIKDDTAFIVFHAPGAKLFQMTMAKEDGEWKATTLSAAVLAPSLNH
jgi:hypothetical protein